MKKLLIISLFIALTLPAWAGEATLTFLWDQAISEDFGGWKLYKSTSPNVAVTPSNLFTTIIYADEQQEEYTAEQTLTSPDGQVTTHYFVLTAFDAEGNETLPSNEVSAVLDFEAPGVPFQLKVTVQRQ